MIGSGARIALAARRSTRIARPRRAAGTADARSVAPETFL